MAYIVKLERHLQKSVSSSAANSQIQKIVSIAMKGGRGSGWKYRIGRLAVEGTTYSVVIHFNVTSERSSLRDKWPRILQRLAEAGSSGAFAGKPWKIIDPPGYDSVAVAAVTEHDRKSTLRVMANEPKVLGEINLDPGDHFDRIFGREAQLRRVMDALRLGQRTDWTKRMHSLLDGPPGCGKSECMMALSRMLGEEGKAWRWFDATSMTRAGAVEEIIENPVVPPVLFIEEIEKCEEAALRWLLGVMDTRGEVRRTNFRVGNQAKHVRMVVVASANNVKLLKSVMSGALYSRFQNKIYYPAPDREIMRLILEREMKEIKGNPEWIEPALKFGVDEWGLTDPRALISIVSCGGDRLLTGEYQKDFVKTMHPEEKRMLLKRLKKTQGTKS